VIYRVKLKTTVTAWKLVEVNDGLYRDLTDQDMREIAADAAIADRHTRALRERLAAAGLEHGPIELAHEELDESVREVTS
jgi:hypothetical protein